MELSSDLVAIQGILISKIKTTGEFSKIYNRSGNEEKILDVMVEIQKFISSRNYIKDGKINSVFDTQLEDIVFFLAINTKCKEPLEMDEYNHLINIMPQLSKCLLINIVYGLDLCKYYCKVIEKLPINYSIELLEETVHCLKKSVPKIHLLYACMFLKAAVNKLMSTSYSEKVEDSIDKVSDVTNLILTGLTGLYSDHIQTLKAVQIYQHMGFCLLSLFDLLLYCDKENINLRKFIRNVLQTCSSLAKNVTINVFCSWAEVDEDDRCLQISVSEKAYLIIEMYQKYEDAKELISMLKTIAKKPKTLAERIQEADISTIIKNIDKRDQDQSIWFQALLNTRIFKHTEAADCVNKWAHLCNENDVERLLKLSVHSSDATAKKLVIKCASNLDTEKLILVITGHYYKNKFKCVLNEDIQPQIMLIFNKLDGKSYADENFVKEISLLLLQNPVGVLSYIYNECLKNSFYTKCLKDTFSTIKEIAQIDNIGVHTLNDSISKCKPNLQNIENYIELLRTFLETNYFSSDVVLTLLYSLLKDSYKKKDAEDLNYLLQIFVGSEIKIPLKEECKTIIELLLNIMNDYRCKFFKFKNINQQNAKYVIDIIMDLCEVNANYNFRVHPRMKIDDDFTIYYKKYLSSETDLSLLKSLYSDFDVGSYAECVKRLIQILPSSVTSEWISISEEIFNKYDHNKGIELLTDIIILLCQVVQTQGPDEQIFTGIKYCIQQFGLVIQQKVQVNSTLDTEIKVTQNVCRLLRQIPDCLKEEEGLSLTSILTERSLKFLAKEKQFVCLLISINNKSICKTLAQKISS